jgi:hypothetical protein
MSLHKFLGFAPPPSKKQKSVETCREYEAKKRKRSLLHLIVYHRLYKKVKINIYIYSSRSSHIFREFFMNVY